MSLDATLVNGLFSVIVSHAQATGVFDQAEQHEPGVIGKGLTFAVWGDSIVPVNTGSGLASTTGLVVFNCRVYTPTVQEPQDAIDPAVFAAASSIIGRIIGDFTLNDLAPLGVDIRGRSGQQIRAQAGYIKPANEVQYRVMTIIIPVLVADAWDEVP
jgi:hypothetical protein